MTHEELKKYRREWARENRRKKLKLPHYCKQCNQKFEQRSNNQKFCSGQCKHKFFLNTKSKKAYQKMKQDEYKDPYKAKISKRECLKCQQMFLSSGVYNRVCNYCKQGAEFKMELDPYAFNR